MAITPMERGAIQAIELTEGETEYKDKSSFLGYAAESYSAEQVRRQLMYLKLKHPEASHIMATYRIPGEDFISNQGLVDDGKHGGARAIMKVLFKEKQENTAVFVVRYYGGKHLGIARFQAIERAAKSALEKAREKIRQARRPPTAAELAQLNAEIQQAADRQAALQLQQERQWGDTESQSEREDNESLATDSQISDSN